MHRFACSIGIGKTKDRSCTSGPDPSGRTVGVYKYNIVSGAEHVMGVSTGAAAFASGSNTVTLGNRELTFRRAIDRPRDAILAEVAVAQSDEVGS